MKQHGKIGWIALVLFLVACGWGATVRAERMPVDFVTVSKEHLDVTASGSGRLQVSWEFTAETESLSLDREARDAAIITVFYEVRLFDHGNTLAAVIPGAAGDTDSVDAENAVGATIFLNDEDFLVMRENALMFSMDASDFNIVAATGSGEVTGRFTKKVSNTARIDSSTWNRRRGMEIVVTEVFLFLPSDPDE